VTSPLLRVHVLTALHAAPAILGSGGSCLLIYNCVHATLEAQLSWTFHTPAAPLFNSGFDANVGFLVRVPQLGDTVLYDAVIHASVHDGVRTSLVDPALRRAFAHNDLSALCAALLAPQSESAALRESESSIFVAVECMYSMVYMSSMEGTV
jgi:8-amino-7-oxononanoate synthase